jgi:hypothetical protein
MFWTRRNHWDWGFGHNGPTDLEPALALETEQRDATDIPLATFAARALPLPCLRKASRDATTGKPARSLDELPALTTCGASKKGRRRGENPAVSSLGNVFLKHWQQAAWIWAGLAMAGCHTAAIQAQQAASHATPAATQEEFYRPRSSSRPIPSSLSDEAVVRVLSHGVGCSGTLITNNLVLTAHHCMVERDSNGEIVDQDLPPSALEVEVGGDYHPGATVAVVAAVAPPCGYRGGNGDIAVLVLSRRLLGFSVMPVRLASPPRTGEPIEPLGFGRCPLSSEASHRIRHEGGNIDDLSPFTLSASASICPGDSGGPARSRVTGEAIGVVSAGIMDDSDQTRDAATFTRLDAWRSLFAKAQLIADGSTNAESRPIVGCEHE